tara:strand:+ start:14087 stop:14863 length:777 start_codon:yes stop_codon:yes gene_type:complete
MNEGGFSFVVPTEFVELPSEGKHYPEGHPLRGETSVEIKQMTAKEEDMLTSRTLLKKGVALDRVLASVISDKSIDPDSLLIGDRNAVIVATRVSGYGNIYSTKVNCPACGEAQEYSFDLNAAEIYSGTDDNIDVTSNNDGTFDVVLPRTGITATFRLLNGYDEKKITSGAEMDKKQKIERNVTRQLSAMLVSANGDSSAQAINYLVENLPSVDSRHLRLAYRQTAPNVDLTQHFECSACNHEQDMEVPLSADFFWPDR